MSVLHKLRFTTEREVVTKEAGKQKMGVGLQYLDFTSEVLEFMRISKMHTRIIAVDLHGSGSSLTLYLEKWFKKHVTSKLGYQIKSKLGTSMC